MKLSVIIPAYRCPAWLEKCLLSVKASVYQDYEIIVVDDASPDATAEIARRYADKVIVMAVNSGCSSARNAGTASASGSICVYIDADVMVMPDTLGKIARYFQEHPEVDALTGRLSAEHPNADFCSQYKNLYMNHIFGLLPDRVSFLYGSVHAVKAELSPRYDPDSPIANDTELGQRLASQGRQIAYLNDLEVIHLKNYDLKSLLRNDFKVPFFWTDFFLRHKGYLQIWKGGSGYLHSPKTQIASIALMPPLLAACAWALLWTASSWWPAGALVSLWMALNWKFHSFLFAARGPWFGIRSIGMTMIDHLVMMSALMWGFTVHGVKALRGR